MSRNFNKLCEAAATNSASLSPSCRFSIKSEHEAVCQFVAAGLKYVCHSGRCECQVWTRSDEITCNCQRSRTAAMDTSEYLFVSRCSLDAEHSALLVSQANRPPAKLNLLTCQVKRNPDEKKSFDLFSRTLQTLTCHSDTYHRVVSSVVSLPVRFLPQTTARITSRPKTKPSVRCKSQKLWRRWPLTCVWLRDLMCCVCAAGCRCCRTVKRRRWTKRSKATRTKERTTSCRSWPRPS